MSDDNKVIKFNAPTKFDTAAEGTIWKQMKDDNRFVLHIQVSNDATTPQWESLGHFLEVALQEMFADKEFMQESLRLFRHHEITAKRIIKKRMIKN